MLALAALLIAQTAESPVAIQKREMAKLEFMVGYWEGTMTSFQSDPPLVAHGYENVRSAAGGTALLDNAKYEAEVNGVKRPVNNLAAMIWFDSARGAHSMRIQSESGFGDQFDLHPSGKGMSWSIKLGAATYNYSLAVTEQGEWIESATAEGAPGKKIFEIRLKRVGPPKEF